MRQKHPIYTEKNDCQDCYKCLKQCHVKAIKIENSSASIIPERCIYCGHCLLVCPVGAKKMRLDIDVLKNDIKSGSKVIACLAPSYVSDFTAISENNLISVLKQLGFSHVSQTALGAEIISSLTMDWLNDQPNGIFISSCCPSVNDYICKYFPELSTSIVPLLSPMQVHAKFLKNTYGENFKVAFIGPCIAKKHETDYSSNLVDYALTFTELKKWLDEDLPNWDTLNCESIHSFVPFPANKATNFPVEGGMIASMQNNLKLMDTSFISFSGFQHITEILNDISKLPNTQKIFLELLMCEGGCIKGPGIINTDSVLLKRNVLLNNSVKLNSYKISNQLVLDFKSANHSFKNIKEIKDIIYSEDQIKNALSSVGKFSLEDELNCGGCGYDNCRDFAAAILQGRAERIMCITYMRRIGQGKASVLLKKMPYGVVIIDENLKVLDSNRKFAELLGNDITEIYDISQNIDGADLRKLVSFYKLFQSVLQSGEEMIEHHIRENEHYLHVSIITIQPCKVVCGIVQNMKNPEIRNDIVIDYTQQVIKKNMEVVQKIAYLLGENASFTESMLNSIVESNEIQECGIR